MYYISLGHCVHILIDTILDKKFYWFCYGVYTQNIFQYYFYCNHIITLCSGITRIYFKGFLIYYILSILLYIVKVIKKNDPINTILQSIHIPIYVWGK